MKKINVGNRHLFGTGKACPWLESKIQSKITFRAFCYTNLLLLLLLF